MVTIIISMSWRIKPLLGIVWNWRVRSLGSCISNTIRMAIRFRALVFRNGYWSFSCILNHITYSWIIFALYCLRTVSLNWRAIKFRISFPHFSFFIRKLYLHAIHISKSSWNCSSVTLHGRTFSSFIIWKLTLIIINVNYYVVINSCPILHLVHIIINLHHRRMVLSHSMWEPYWRIFQAIWLNSLAISMYLLLRILNRVSLLIEIQDFITILLELLYTLIPIRVLIPTALLSFIIIAIIVWLNLTMIHYIRILIRGSIWYHTLIKALTTSASTSSTKSRLSFESSIFN